VVCFHMYLTLFVTEQLEDHEQFCGFYMIFCAEGFSLLHYKSTVLYKLFCLYFSTLSIRSCFPSFLYPMGDTCYLSSCRVAQDGVGPLKKLLCQGEAFDCLDCKSFPLRKGSGPSPVNAS